MVYLAAFLIPAAIYAAALFATKTFPFGDNALIISDISNQFDAFYSYFKHILLSNDDFLYTFSKTLGGDMPGFSGYYLNNPFLFLLLPIKDAYIPAGVVLIIGLQLSLMSVSMAVFLKDIASDRKTDNIMIVMFSTAYAFSGYNLAYITLPMYFCSFIMLPLVMLGIRRIALGGRKRLYIISLALAIFFNYYIGYMICIFSVLFFLCTIISEGKHRDKKVYADFALSSLAAGGLSAFSVIPTVLSLRGQKEAPSVAALSPHINYNLKLLIRNLFTGAFKGDLSNYCAPYIYVGEAALLCVAVFVISRKIAIRKRLATLILLIVLIGSTMISTIDVMWHGFNAPVGFAYRYAFLICTVLIVAGFEGCRALFDSIAKEGKGERLAKSAVLILSAAEIALLGINAVTSLRAHENRTLSEYAAYYENVDTIISKIREDDPSFYRIEKDFERNHNDAMMFGYSGISHNSSCERDYVKEFAAKMGFRYFAPIWTYYNQGSTVFADCLLGVKYFISRFDTTIKPYEFCFLADGKNAHGDDMTAHVFKNPYVLPLVFTMSEEELATDMSDPNLFEIQNGMAGEQIYKRAADPVSDVTTDRLSLDVTMPFDGNLYFYATAPSQQKAALYINGEPADEYFSESRWDIVCVGLYEAGDVVNITLEAADEPISVDEVYIYAEDQRELVKWYEKASGSAGELDKITSSHLKGRINVGEGERTVFSIPYEKAWKISIDGVKTEPEKAFGALLSVPAAPGEHTIEMRYVPEGLVAGSVISVLTLLVCLGLTFFGGTIKIKS